MKKRFQPRLCESLSPANYLRSLAIQFTDWVNGEETEFDERGFPKSKVEAE